jgi:hypothetical protein
LVEEPGTREGKRDDSRQIKKFTEGEGGSRQINKFAKKIIK